MNAAGQLQAEEARRLSKVARHARAVAETAAKVELCVVEALSGRKRVELRGLGTVNVKAALAVLVKETEIC